MPDVWVLTEWALNDRGEKTWAVVADYPAPLGWSDKTGQVDAAILNGQDVAVVEGRLTDAQVTTLQADTRYSLLNIGNPSTAPDLNSIARAALKTEVALLMHLDVATYVTDESPAPAVIIDTLKASITRPAWRAGLSVSLGQVYLYERNLYEVVQAHTTQADWTPTAAVALWKHYRDSGVLEAWVQPLGAHDAYPVGWKVLHNGLTWQNTSPANVFEPGVFGWTNLTPPPATANWAVGVAYSVNAEVLYNGTRYRCRQAHTSQVGWQPPNVPALWLAI